MGGKLFTQENLIIPLTTLSADCTANLECDSFSLKHWDHATIMIMFSATLSGDNVLTIECGATDSADTSDATFHYRLASAAPNVANSDVLAADATAATLTLTAATYQGKMLVLEIDAEELPKSGETVYDWVTVDLDGTASTCTCMAFAVLSRGRYADAILATATA